MRAALGRLRQRPFLILFAIASLVAVLMVLFRSETWVGVWPQTAVASQIPGVFLGIIGAGYAAWSASRERRLGLVDQLSVSVVPRWRRETVELGAITVALASGYGVGVLYGVARTAPGLPPGFGLTVGYWFVGLTAILFGVATGWLLGKLLPTRIAAIAAAATVFILVAYIGSDALAMVSGYPDRIVNLPSLAVRMLALMLWWLVSVLMPPLREWRGGHGVKPTAPLLAVLGAGAALVLWSSSGLLGTPQVPRNAVEPLCTQGETTLCVWPEHEKYLPMLSDLSERIALLPPELLLPAGVVWDAGLRTQYFFPESDGIFDLTGESEEEPSFMIHDGSAWSVASSLSSLITWQGYDVECSWDHPEAQASAIKLEAWTEYYLAGGGVPDYSASGDPAILALREEGATWASPDLPYEEQHTWVAAEIDKYRGVCAALPDGSN